MKITELATFDVAHDKLSWPWIAFDASGKRFAFASSSTSIASRMFDGGQQIVEGPSFALPANLLLPTTALAEPHHDTTAGVHAFAIDGGGNLLAVVGVVEGRGVVVMVGAGGEERRSELDTLAGPGFIAQAIAFDRSGERLWISAEDGKGTALLLVDVASFERVGILRSAALPPPATHELYLHPQEDAVVLLAACGQDGTFARVARFVDGQVEASATSMDDGNISAGFAGFSPDGGLLYLAEADELRTHAWPDLKDLSSTPFEGDFVSSYSGIAIGEGVLVDGEDSETGEDAVMLFDRTGTKGKLLPPPAPVGMWAGKLGSDLLITVEAKGEPARARVLRVIV